MNLANDGIQALAALPFAPGTSPFRVKGTAFRGHFEYVTRVFPPGLERMLDAIDDPALKDFFRQHFLASSFYDVFPLAWAAVIGAKMSKMPYLDFVRIRTREQAKLDVGGVYRVLLALASPNAVAQRLPRLVSQYFNFGGATVQKNVPGEVMAVQSGMPLPLVPWYEVLVTNYCEVVLSRAGAKNLQVKCTRADGGQAHGIPLMDLHLEMKFDR